MFLARLDTRSRDSALCLLLAQKCKVGRVTSSPCAVGAALSDKGKPDNNHMLTKNGMLHVSRLRLHVLSRRPRGLRCL